MRAPSKSQIKRFKAQKDPKHKARVTKRHESAVKYNRNTEKREIADELTTSKE